VKYKAFYILICCVIFNINYSFSQKNDIYISDSIPTVEEGLNPLAPSTAAFYSAVIPGLGQAYNKKYWKIPIVYAVLGTSTYFYIDNNKQYNRTRTAFKLLKAGKPHEFDGLNGNDLLSEEALVRAQKGYKEDRDLSLFITIGLYALQVIEASVDAHLMQLNTDNNLSFNPNLLIDPITNQVVAGVSISYSFN
jgi:hypothetical protein